MKRPRSRPQFAAATALVGALTIHATTAQGELRVTVRVVDSARRPIADAEVIRTLSWRTNSSPESLLSARQFPLAKVRGRAKTNSRLSTVINYLSTAC